MHVVSNSDEGEESNVLSAKTSTGSQLFHSVREIKGTGIAVYLCDENLRENFSKRCSIRHYTIEKHMYAGRVVIYIIRKFIRRVDGL